MKLWISTLVNSKTPESHLIVSRNNEINVAVGYTMDNGNLYFNHRGCVEPVEALFFERGTGDHSLTTIKVRDVLIGNTSVKSKLGI